LRSSCKSATKLPRIRVAAAITHDRITAFCARAPETETTAVSARIIARKPTALGSQASTAAITVGEPW
jgi:hypothetical protein